MKTFIKVVLMLTVVVMIMVNFNLNINQKVNLSDFQLENISALTANANAEDGSCSTVCLFVNDYSVSCQICGSCGIVSGYVPINSNGLCPY